ncbi:hypothetical protein C8A00DRAFT_36232 [Chaetomidium leptoderma]|uniref:Uncharacterized protein n=1 Tax=Chaetomidium leptoderma TaxID=669021 RepID=A0AAN6VII3_9PEZI|nr:hypothetical protein C8A00DRAFT_36232 [Chaetomidium leptoderma]
MSSYDPRGYMQYESIREYYNKLTKDSPENVVGYLWSNILREYFLIKEGFQFEVQPRPLPDETKQSYNVTVRYIKNGKKKPLIFIKNKGVSKEGGEGVWKEAVDELTENMKLTRSDLPSEAQAEDMFAIVAVGHSSRFYILKASESTLKDWHPTTAGNVLDLKRDEALIVDLLLSIKAQALRASSGAFQEADAGPGASASATGSRPSSSGSGR